MALVIGLGLGLGLAVSPVWGQPGTSNLPEYPPLTLDVLQQRLRTPVQRDGRPTLNLKNLTLDLRPESPLQADFYRLVKQALQ
ncbi:hypothetical protein, partial [Haemophilus parainfluenzae]|uniref:hypothetical protein n=1 Tax=Haemophilus parainfluenzae TaxID=729 RepID=UPI001CEDED08